ncbi:MAG: hypothetical protein C0490_23015, partial [Marivirga sp.]|nr:hypothetical protein [Marivirga sp.]
MNYYNLNGIQSPNPATNLIVTDWQGGFVMNNNDNTPEIDSKLIEIGHRAAAKLFGSIQNFNNLLPTLSMAYPYGGVDAEVKVSKNEFEKWVNSVRSPENHKILFYYDVQNLIGSLQNLVQESRHLFCEFYKILNRNSFMLIDRPMQPDIVMFASGQIVSGIFSEINHLFINLASQLDFVTKIAFELEHLPQNFDEYPKLRSRGILFGDFNL